MTRIKNWSGHVHVPLDKLLTLRVEYSRMDLTVQLVSSAVVQQHGEPLQPHIVANLSVHQHKLPGDQSVPPV